MRNRLMPSALLLAIIVFSGCDGCLDGCSKARAAETGKRATNENVPIDIDLVPQGGEGIEIFEGKVTLLKGVPTQKDGDPIVIEAEAASNLIWQPEIGLALRNATGQRTDQHYMVDAVEWRVQDDDLASGGKFVNFVSTATYTFRATTPGSYKIYLRIKNVNVDPVTVWSNIVLNGKNHRLQLASPPAKDIKPGEKPWEKWNWVRGASVVLREGDYALQVADLHDGVCLDKIAFVPENAPVKDDFDPAPSPATEVKSGYVETEEVAPPALVKWRAVLHVVEGSACGMEYSVDGGNVWVKTDGKLDGVAVRGDGADKMKFRFRLTRSGDENVVLSQIKVRAELSGQSVAVLENEHYRMFFNRETLALLGMINRRTGVPLTMIGKPVLYVRLKLGKRGNLSYEFQQDEFEIVKRNFSKSGAQFAWTVMDGKVRIEMDVKIDKTPLSRWQIRLKNDSDYRILSVTFPDLSGLRIGSDFKDDVLIMPDHSGRRIDNPAQSGAFERVYCGSASMSWMDLYDGSGGLYLAAYNKVLRVTDLKTVPAPTGDSITLSIKRYDSIAKGDSPTPIDYAIGIHTGDWHWAADRYREYFTETFGKTMHPEWMQESDGYTANRDPRWLRWLGLVHSQVWGEAGGGACPTWYMPHNNALSGPPKGWTADDYVKEQKRFADINQRLRDDGCHVGYYIHGSSISPYYCFSDTIYDIPRTDFPEELRPPDGEWFKRNRLYAYPTDDPAHEPEWKSLWGPPGRRGESYPLMSAQVSEWRAYLQKWTDIYVKRYNCDVIYFDCVGARPAFVNFNPHYDMYGDATWTEGVLQMFYDMREEALKTTPSWTNLIEGCGDVYGLLVGHMISNFDSHQYIYRYTLQDQICFSGLSNGGWTRPRPIIRRTFINGSRFDLMKPGLHFKTAIALRRAVKMFQYYPHAFFMDDIGLTASSSIKAKIFKTESAGAKAFTVAVDNHTNAKGAKIRVDLKHYFPVKRAVAFCWDGIVKKADFEIKDNVLEAEVPEDYLSALVFVDEISDARAVNIMLEENYVAAERGLKATFTNLSGTEKDIAFKLEKGKHEFRTTDGRMKLAPGEIRVVNLPYTDFDKVLDADTQWLTAAFDGRTEKRWIGIMPIVPNGGFEESGTEVAGVPEGTKCLVIEGNGASQLASIAVNFKPDATYEITLKIKREGTWKNSYLALFSHIPEHAKSNWSRGFDNTKEPHDWKEVKYRFTTPAEVDSGRLYAYFHGAEGTMYIDDVRARLIGDGTVKE